MTGRMLNNVFMQPFLLQSPHAQANQAGENGVSEGSRPPETTPLKNSNRIDDILCRMSVEATEVVFLSSWAARTMRRDWNIICSKMYVFGLNPSYKARIQEDLTELHWQVSDLADVTGTDLFAVQDLTWLAPTIMELRIVNPHASSLLRAIRSLDLSMARLLTAERNALIDKEKRQAMLSGVNMAYIGFKGTAMKVPMKSTSEMLQESNLI